MKRIVIKVQLETDRCRSKALKIAAKSQGVQSLSLEGASSDLVVIGNDVDPVCLTNQMRKKFRYVKLLSVEDLEEDGGELKEQQEEEAEAEDEEEAVSPKQNALSLTHYYDNHDHLPTCPIYTTYVPPCPICATASANYYPPSAPMYRPTLYDNSYPNSCTIV